MGFKCGIVGLPNVGKSTLFNALTQTAAAQAANYPFCTIEPNVGDVAVPDARLDTLAAIAGRGAAERYGLEILAADVEDRPDNQTRFLAVVRRGTAAAPLAAAHGGAMKTALLAETANTPGALVGILAPFAARGINLGC